MTSPLAAFANARLLLETPGARGGPENGYKRAPGQQVVVEVFLKQLSPEAGTAYRQLVASSVANDFLSGYVVAYAPVPAGADWRTIELASAAGVEATGLRPAALRKGLKLAGLVFGSRFTAAAEVIEAAGAYDDHGIGGIVRSIIGDRIVIAAEWRE